jgi:hypothetical protein
MVEPATVFTWLLEVHKPDMTADHAHIEDWLSSIVEAPSTVLFRFRKSVPAFVFVTTIVYTVSARENHGTSRVTRLTHIHVHACAVARRPAQSPP